MSKKKIRKNKKLWGGRFEASLHPDAVELSYTLHEDMRLVVYDIRVNQAHCAALHKAGHLDESEYNTLHSCLATLQEAFQRDPESLLGNDEDIHSCIERLVTERCDDLGKKMHTGKSRNDQVITDARLFTKDALTRLIHECQALVNVLVSCAETYKSQLFPGFTHFQPAQPVLFSHYVLAYAQKFMRDITRFEHAYVTTDVCPLGSGALAGNNYALDRHFIAEKLGFSAITHNSMDAVSDRDFMCETLAAASLCMTHLSRFCEDIIVFCSPLIGFIELSDNVTTGSSLMPQKKNPDIAELIRGKTVRVHANWHALQTTLKGLPLTYNRDLQEDKPHLYDSVDTVENCLRCFRIMIEGMSLNDTAIKAGLEKGYGVATDLADYLVAKGVPFRDAHDQTGKIILAAISANKQLHEMPLKTLQSYSDKIEGDIFTHIRYDAAVQAKTIVGGTAETAVLEQIKDIKRRMTWET